MCRDAIRDSKGAEQLSGDGDGVQVRFGKSDGGAKKNDTKRGGLWVCACVYACIYATLRSPTFYIPADLDICIYTVYALRVNFLMKRWKGQ